MALQDNDFRIVIIEDDEEMRSMLERYLRMVGMETESYPDTADVTPVSSSRWN